jgi:hypothetical protein
MIATILAASSSGLLIGLVHLIITLIVLAICYYIIAWILGKLGAPAIIGTLVMILFALIALYFVIVFLLSITNAF